MNLAIALFGLLLSAVMVTAKRNSLKVLKVHIADEMNIQADEAAAEPEEADEAIMQAATATKNILADEAAAEREAQTLTLVDNAAKPEDKARRLTRQEFKNVQAQEDSEDPGWGEINIQADEAAAEPEEADEAVVQAANGREAGGPGHEAGGPRREAGGPRRAAERDCRGVKVYHDIGDESGMRWYQCRSCCHPWDPDCDCASDCNRC